MVPRFTIISNSVGDEREYIYFVTFQNQAVGRWQIIIDASSSRVIRDIFPFYYCISSRIFLLNVASDDETNLSLVPKARASESETAQQEALPSLFGIQS